VGNRGTGGRLGDQLADRRGRLASWECIAPYGHLVEIGKKDVISNSSLQMWSFRRNAPYCSLDVAWWLQKRPLFDAPTKEIMALFDEGVFRPVQPLQVCDMSKVQQVFRRLQSGHNIGKFVLDFEPDSQVPVSSSARTARGRHGDSDPEFLGNAG
jgi:hypothetical protein